MENIFVEFLPPWVETGLQPAFYDKESGTVLQQTARMYARVNMLIRMFNKLSKQTKETVDHYIEEFTTLYNYVHDYFDNLDVQEEINNKLDGLVEDGTMQELVNNYLEPNIEWTFNSVADMKLSENLKEGSFAQTYGYYAVDDEGGAKYIIRLKTNDDVIDEASIIAIADDTLVAELIVEDNTISVKQFGAKGDNTADDTNAFKAAISYISGKYMNLYINAGKYLINETLYVDWQNTNFWQNFNGSYSIKGAGIYQSILKFSGSTGMSINRNQNILSIEIEDFSIVNESYNPLEEATVTAKPDDTKGCGLRLNHIGYTGHVARIGVRGFYIGIATRRCYGGPIIDNAFTYNTVFGYSSKNDTTVEHNSCSYMGYESCYIQEGSHNILTNVICEGTLEAFKTNTYNQRGKFNSRGFSFYGEAKAELDNCYSERLFGNARYIEDSVIIENNSVCNNNMNWYLNQSGYEDMATWVTNNSWNYDEIYVYIKTAGKTSCIYTNPEIEYGTAFVQDDHPNHMQDTDGKYNAPNVVFIGVKLITDSITTFNRFAHGNCKPIVRIMGTYEKFQENYTKWPINMYGMLKSKNNLSATNWNGSPSVEISRIGTFNDNTYNEVMLRMRQNLSGECVLYRVTLLNGTEVDSKEVMKIASDGKVTFAQN